MKAKTFDDWKAGGFRVRKGEKATGRDKQGVPTFTREQVDEDDFFDRQNDLHFKGIDHG